MPVVTPFLASIDTVKAVFGFLDILTDDINVRFNFLA